MPSPYITKTVANRMLDTGIRLKANSAALRIYSGTVPADADTALGAQVVLATLTMNATAFPAASGGVLTANAITADSSADASGTASFFRLFGSDSNNQVLLQGTVGTSGTDMILNSVAISSGANVSISSFTITLPTT